MCHHLTKFDTELLMVDLQRLNSIKLYFDLKTDVFIFM